MQPTFDKSLTVEQIYGDWKREWDDCIEMVDASLDPRPRTSIYDTFGTLGIGEGDRVLDIGGRDSAQALELAARFGCEVLSVDPVKANLDAGTRSIADHPFGHLVDNALGTINEIPAEDSSFDAIFARDVLSHVEDLIGALAECRRVLEPGGSMLIHYVFATDSLEPKVAAMLHSDLALAPGRLDLESFEQDVVTSGFTIESTDRVASEWLESLLEEEDGERRLLRAARLNRAPEQYLEEMGEVAFRVVRSNNLWTIYRMIGKLEDRVVVIRAQ